MGAHIKISGGQFTFGFPKKMSIFYESVTERNVEVSTFPDFSLYEFDTELNDTSDVIIEDEPKSGLVVVDSGHAGLLPGVVTGLIRDLNPLLWVSRYFQAQWIAMR